MRHRLVLGLAVVLAACSSGGSGGSNPVPFVPWASFRHDNANSAAGSGINSNKGQVAQLCTTTGQTGIMPCPGMLTLSTPTVDRNGNVLLATTNGVASFDGRARCSEHQSQECTADSCLPYGATCDEDTHRCTGGVGPDIDCMRDSCEPDKGVCTGKVRWVLDQCALGDSAPIPVGPVEASPSVTPGNYIVFGTEPTVGQPGRLFAAKEVHSDVECNWVFPSVGAPPGFGIVSSAATQIYTLDLTLTTVIVGADDGRVRALNFDGSLRWTYPDAPGDPITSTPALDLNSNVYVTTADGILSAVDFTGRPMWRAPLGIAPATRLYPSPTVATTVYAVGAGGTLFGINPGGGQKWQFTPERSLSGSPAFLLQAFPDGAINVSDTIVYVVDTASTAYGVRDLTGQVIQLQTCSGDPTIVCQTDSCAPLGQSCDTNTNRCTGGVDPDERCTRDTCLDSPEHGECTVSPGRLQMTNSPIALDTSATITTDQFIVIGTSDGTLCARTLIGLAPGFNLSPVTPTWEETGCIPLSNGSPVRSSPVIGLNGRIYVTTDDGLYVIK